MDLYKYQAYTLVDITKTDVITYSTELELQRNQQRNWETVVQLLSLRAQVMDLEYLGYTEEDLTPYSFGVDYAGLHKVWRFKFAVEREDIYGINQDRYGAIKDDFKIAPVILDLTETATLPLPLFYASGPNKNIYFKSIA